MMGTLMDRRATTRRVDAARRALLATCLAMMLAACGGPSAEDAGATEAPPAMLGPGVVAIAESGEVASGVVLTGSLEPSEVVTVRAQVPGTLTGVRVDRGTPVRRGQVMAVVQAAGIRSEAAGARAAVAAAEANLALAQRRLDAARRLHEAGATSAIELRTVEAAYEAQRAQVAVARAQSASAGEAAGRATIVAPINGVVSDRRAEDGEAVSPGTELFTVVDSRTLELSGQVPVDQAAGVRVGQPVVFTLDAQPGRELRGSVARVDPVADAQTRRVGVYVSLPNPKSSIIGGQFARGRIVGEAATSAIVVPVGAVRQVGGPPFVLLVADGRIARREVTLGPRDESRGVVAVTAGLKAGDRVIATPNVDLSDGARVTVAADQPAPPTAAPKGGS